MFHLFTTFVPASTSIFLELHADFDSTPELPGYAPGAAYRALELLLGRIDTLSQEGDFTTQTGNFTGTSTIYEKNVRYGYGY